MGDRPDLLSGDTRWCNPVKNHSSRAVGVLVIKTHSYGHDCYSWDQLDSWHHYQNLVWSSKHEVHNECIPFWMSISATIIYFYPRLFDQVSSSKRSGSADAVSVTFSKWWENKATSCTWKKQRNIWRHDHSVIQPRIGIPVYQYSIKLQQSTINHIYAFLPPTPRFVDLPLTTEASCWKVSVDGTRIVARLLDRRHVAFHSLIIVVPWVISPHLEPISNESGSASRLNMTWIRMHFNMIYHCNSLKTDLFFNASRILKASLFGFHLRPNPTLALSS